MTATRRSLLVIGILVAALNLRPAAASVGPLLTRIRADTGLSGAGAGVLTTLPVVCFGAVAPLAPVLARRWGTTTAIAGAVVALTIGIALRVVPAIEFLFLGTVVAGAGIAVGNVLLPVLVRRNFHEHTGVITGAYTTALIGFSALAAGVTVPVADVLGGGWRPGLGIWALPAAVAAIVWVPLARRGARDPRNEGEPNAYSQPDTAGGRALLRDPLAWQVTLFFAIQSAGFYASLAWLPSIFQSHGASESRAGVLLAASMIAGLVSALLVPSLAARRRDQRALAVAVTAMTASGWIGILAAPMSAPFLWVAILGLGQNGSFPLVVTMIVLRGGTVTNTARLSTMAQTVGYLIAAAAPLSAGALHDATGSWAPVVVGLLALTVPQALAGAAAGRPATVLSQSRMTGGGALTRWRRRTGRAGQSS